MKKVLTLSLLALFVSHGALAATTRSITTILPCHLMTQTQR
jgi:hypothetical protein